MGIYEHIDHNLCEAFFNRLQNLELAMSKLPKKVKIYKLKELSRSLSSTSPVASSANTSSISITFCASLFAIFDIFSYALNSVFISPSVISAYTFTLDINTYSSCSIQPMSQHHVHQI